MPSFTKRRSMTGAHCSETLQQSSKISGGQDRCQGHYNLHGEKPLKPTMSSCGWQGGRFTPLDESQVRTLHNTALDILEQRGTQVNSKLALQTFQDGGAWVDAERRVVRLPRAMVEDALATAPSRVLLAGREEKYDLELADSRVYLGTGGTALYVLDLEGNRRQSTLRDVAEIARLADALENVHFIVIPVYPNELPLEQVDINRFHASLLNCSKHIQGGVYTMEGIRQVIKMAEEIVGGTEALRRRPIVSFITCLVSPLKIDADYGDFLVEICRQGLPVSISIEPLSGATAPITLAGHLTQWAAEALSGVTLAQLVNPGTPCLVGYVGTITDLRTMGYVSGAIEQGLLNAGAAQLAHYWRVPLYATSGMSDAKVLDAQCGYEGAMTTLMACLAGANFIHDAVGLMEFAMTVSYGKLVLDNEIVGMAMRAVRGIEVNEATIAADVIKEIGPGGNYLISEHTVRYMRDEFYFPTLSDRQSRQDWEASGARTVQERANERARHLLATHRPLPFPPGVEDRLLGIIPGLVGI
ncbi:MAG: trimethylamine methyltransferase family protein [Anaerolineae bacterium]